VARGCVLQESLDYEEIQRAVEGICLSTVLDSNILLCEFLQGSDCRIVALCDIV